MFVLSQTVIARPPIEDPFLRQSALVFKETRQGCAVGILNRNRDINFPFGNQYSKYSHPRQYRIKYSGILSKIRFLFAEHWLTTDVIDCIYFFHYIFFTLTLYRQPMRPCCSMAVQICMPFWTSQVKVELGITLSWSHFLPVSPQTQKRVSNTILLLYSWLCPQ